MTTTFGSKLATLVLTVLVSGTLVLGAVGPAAGGAGAPSPIARAAA